MAVAPQLNEDIFGTKVFTITFTIRNSDNTVDRTDAGYLEVGANSGATITGQGTHSLTIIGAQAPCNTAMANLNYVPSADFTEDVGVSYAQSNDSDGDTHDDFMLMSVRDTHDEFNSGAFVYNEDEIIVFAPAQITDLRGNTLPDTQYQVDLTLSDPNAGLLNQSTITGTKSQVNSALSKITFTPSADYTDNFTIGYAQQQTTDSIDHGNTVIEMNIGDTHDDFDQLISDLSGKPGHEILFNFGQITDLRPDNIDPSIQYKLDVTVPESATVSGSDAFFDGVYTYQGRKSEINEKVSNSKILFTSIEYADITVSVTQIYDNLLQYTGIITTNIAPTKVDSVSLYYGTESNHDCNGQWTVLDSDTTYHWAARRYKDNEYDSVLPYTRIKNNQVSITPDGTILCGSNSVFGDLSISEVGKELIEIYEKDYLYDGYWYGSPVGITNNGRFAVFSTQPDKGGELYSFVKISDDQSFKSWVRTHIATAENDDRLYFRDMSKESGDRILASLQPVTWDRFYVIYSTTGDLLQTIQVDDLDHGASMSADARFIVLHNGDVYKSDDRLSWSFLQNITNIIPGETIVYTNIGMNTITVVPDQYVWTSEGDGPDDPDNVLDAYTVVYNEKLNSFIPDTHITIRPEFPDEIQNSRFHVGSPSTSADDSAVTFNVVGGSKAYSQIHRAVLR